MRARLGNPEAVDVIHGGVAREERRKVIERFMQDKDLLVLIANDAAGEGVNLQRGHLMVNYDLPWNPNKIEQRFGRIHRIGQTEVCHLWNLVAADTREGEVYARLHYRVSLNDLGTATLNAPKVADGLQALQWFKDGRLDLLEIYCRKDVEVTRDLFHHGLEHGYLLFDRKGKGRMRLPLDWALEVLVGQRHNLTCR